MAQMMYMHYVAKVICGLQVHGLSSLARTCSCWRL